MSRLGFRVKRLTPTKYRNDRVFVAGRWFDSKKEAKRYGELLLLAQAGEITDLKCQVVFKLDVNGHHICRYIADFTYRTPGGDLIVEDVKGVRTDVYRLKAKLMWAVHGIAILET